MFDLEYCNWNKDMFMGVLPDSQFGDVASIDVGVTSVPVSDASYSQISRFDLNISIFPFLAYKKFCQDYFRYSQWQNSCPYLWYIDYYTGTSQNLFVTGHSEYSPNTLDDEYKRDIEKGLPIDLPQNYYIDNNPNNPVNVRWRSHGNLLFTNWLNYFVYQETPYDIDKIE